MAVFRFKGRNKAGNIVEGERIARTAQEISLSLERDQIRVLSIEKKKIAVRIPFISGKGGRKKVSLKELSVFNRQLSVMFNAGLPITQGLGILAAQQKNKYFEEVLQEVRRDVEAGSNFSNALRKYPDVFNNLYTSMIQAGEASGNLDTILMRLSEYIENMQKIVRRVKSAMTYPIVVIVLAVLITALILWKVVPIFEDMFSQLGAVLPMPTQIVMAASDFLQSYFLLIIVAMVGIFFAFKSYYGTYKGKRVIDKIKLKVIVFGDLLLKVGVARVTRTMATLLDSGVEIIEAITITSKTAGNATIEDAVFKSRASVQEGKPLYSSWEETGIFPFMVTQMVSVGEQTGALSSMLGKIADFYDEEVDAAVAALISIMEPIMILILGGLVGSVVVAMYLPMFSIIGQVG
jgi:type IV pilus assembly protein PilC